jgi:hypothetical protein
VLSGPVKNLETPNLMSFIHQRGYRQQRPGPHFPLIQKEPKKNFHFPTETQIEREREREEEEEEVSRLQE